MSLNKITYLDQFYPSGLYFITDPFFVHLYHIHWVELTHFLKTLRNDRFYVVSFEFIFSEDYYDDDSPKIILSKPILITKNSNPKIIYDFLQDKINLVIDAYHLDKELLNMLDGPIILIKYSDINLF